MAEEKEWMGPRLCAEERRRSRFYEAFVLLHVLDRNGERQNIQIPEDMASSQWQRQELRRSFLNQLAYVCDFTKGGDTVTAIAIEGQPSETIFWLASNEEPSIETKLFLQGILNTLKRIATRANVVSESNVEDEIARTCIEFNKKRIKAYRACIRKPLELSLGYLEKCGCSRDHQLSDWLRGFQGFEGTQPEFCQFAYEQRSCKSMGDLQAHIGDDSTELCEKESKKMSFFLTRHYIGRLGSHIKAAKILATAARGLSDVFLKSLTVKIRHSPKPPSLPPPTDHMTTLKGVLTRMLPVNSLSKPKFEEDLIAMDNKFKIETRLKGQFVAKDFRPRVHAELNLLEYFYKKQLPFLDNDRYIGCSKPACYCCYHYISSHPGGFVRPASHGVRYLIWRPPDLIDPTDEQEQSHQLDLLNKVVAQVRRDVFRQIEQRRGPGMWHPDSTSGITASLIRKPLLNGTSYSAHGAREVRRDARTEKAKSTQLETLSGSIRDGENSDSDGGVSLTTTSS